MSSSVFSRERMREVAETVLWCPCLAPAPRQKAKSASTLGRRDPMAALDTGLDTGRVSSRGMEVDLLRNNVLPEHFSFAQEVETA
jgi:hypothetical protein